MKLRVTIDGQSFEVEVGDLSARPVLATVDGETFEVWPEGDSRPTETAAPRVTAVPAPAAPAAAAPQAGNGKAAANARAVLAPIPGVILSVSVKPGDSVVFGQELCVLEAMKMKNVIRANRAGAVAAVCVAAGDQVKHGQALLEFTD